MAFERGSAESLLVRVHGTEDEQTVSLQGEIDLATAGHDATSDFSKCRAGTYTGTFECKIATDGSNPFLPGGFEISGPVSFTLEASEQLNEFSLVIKSGALEAAANLFFGIRANLEGSLDCFTDEFRADFADGALPLLTGPDTLADFTIPTLARHAATAGRPIPRSFPVLPPKPRAHLQSSARRVCRPASSHLECRKGHQRAEESQNVEPGDHRGFCPAELFEVMM
jgi:hypothetical protein